MATEKKTTAQKAATKKATAKKTVAKKAAKAVVKHIGLVKNDPYLADYENAIKGRHDHALWKLGQLTNNGKQTLSDFANGYEYFGLHKTARGWVFREWAPNATDIYLIGDFNNWQETEKYRAKRIKNTGNWELKLPEKAMKHGDLFKMKVHWEGGEGERIPAWAQRVVQDDQTKIFSAQVWNPEQYKWKRKPSDQMWHLCSSMNAISVWHRMLRRLALTQNLRRMCCHVSSRMVITAFRLWLSRSIRIMAPSAIM